MRKIWVLVLVAACGKSADKPADKPAEKTVETKVADKKPDDKKPDDKKPDDKKPDGKKKPPPTKAQRTDYATHMRAGWAKQKTNEWAAAVPEFEAALVAIDGDPRALTELGYSAMLAGDYVKAKKIDEQAIAVAIDPKVRAMGLFNLGLVQEKSGDKDGALKSYLKSLQLRPNATVEKAVGNLGTKPPADAPWCAAGKKACDCVLAAEWGEVDPQYMPKCDPVTDPMLASLPGFHIYDTADMGRDATYLLDEHDQFVAHVGGGIEHGHRFSQMKVTKAEVKKVGTHQVLWLETTEEADTTMPPPDADPRAIFVDETDTIVAVTLCVIGDAKTPTKCPVSEVIRSSIHDSMTTGEKDANDQMPILKHDHQDTELDVTLADDGTATFKLVTGSIDPDLTVVGPHKLW